jgi:myo-inositol-1(or 4)-monophosphatase
MVTRFRRRRYSVAIFDPPRRGRSIALRIAMVAADEADVCASLRWGNEWDIAAAARLSERADAASIVPR